MLSIGVPKLLISQLLLAIFLLKKLFQILQFCRYVLMQLLNWHGIRINCA